MGSGESVDEILSGRLQAHIVQPGVLGLHQNRECGIARKTGRDLVTEHRQSGAFAGRNCDVEAHGGGHRLGEEAPGLVGHPRAGANPKGWQAYGFPSGAIQVRPHPSAVQQQRADFAVCGGVRGDRQNRGLTVADLDKPRTGEFVAAIQQSVVHYGSSTGFFGRKMFANGPQYLSAAVLYENMVVESYGAPKSGVPGGGDLSQRRNFLERPPDRHRRPRLGQPGAPGGGQDLHPVPPGKAATGEALRYGFRPGSVEVPRAAPIDAAHGVDPPEPKTTLEVPSVEVIDGILKLWQKEKKSADVVLALDTSGSMREDRKMENAKQGAKQLLSLLSDEDTSLATSLQPGAELGRPRPPHEGQP